MTIPKGALKSMNMRLFYQKYTLDSLPTSRFQIRVSKCKCCDYPEKDYQTYDWSVFQTPGWTQVRHCW